MAEHRAESRMATMSRGRPPADLLEFIARARRPAFATDETGSITVWNKEAESLLGYPARRVLGKRCDEILCGRDLFGNSFCTRRCALTCMVERRQPVRHFEMDVRTESGEMIATGLTIVVLPGARGGQYTMIHFIEKVDRQHEMTTLIHRMLHDPQSPPVPATVDWKVPAEARPQLTSREIQILRLLAEGTSTHDIATSLFISVATARNHVQNILRKLDVHSKLEAVTLAVRTHLL